MSSSKPIIPLIRRGTNHCLDLAMMYMGRFPGVILGIWMLIALPCSLTVYAFASRGEMDLRLVVVLIYFATLPLGVLVMNDAVPRIFGQARETTSERRRHANRGLYLVGAVFIVLGLAWAFLAENLGDRLGLSLRMRTWSIWGGVGLAALILGIGTLVSVARYQRIDWSTARMFFLGLCLRSACGLGLVLLLFPPFADWRLAAVLVLTILPGIWLALRTGFLLEQVCLSRLGLALEHTAGQDVLKEEAGELFGRATWMAQFFVLLWGVAFLSFDALSSLLFRMPIFLGRLSDLPQGTSTWEYIVQAWELFAHDPLVLATLTATALLVYPIDRLAWFFCYIDIRVRRDCWDLELQFTDAARSLSSAREVQNSTR